MEDNVKKGMYICMTGSLCYTTEIGTAMYITIVQKKKKRMCRGEQQIGIVNIQMLRHILEYKSTVSV